MFATLSTGLLAEPEPAVAELLEYCLAHIKGEENQVILRASAGSYAWAWQTHFGREHDPSQVLGELNLFRYRPCRRVLLRIDEESSRVAVVQVLLETATTGVLLEISATSVAGWTWLKELTLRTVENRTIENIVEEDEPGLLVRLANGKFERMRLLVSPSTPLAEAANRALVHVVDAPVLANGRLELRHYLREQAISQTVHRYGNLTGGDAQPHN
jgi:RHH-type proline utilization regulon transcriptional repressor/proline dehydrogenase/delta 1-pyrroline-5-carboxylate dehydrogenase